MKTTSRLLLSLIMIAALASLSLAAPAGDPASEAFRTTFLSGKMPWSQVLEQAKQEGEVNWFFWGGSDELNTWVDTKVAPPLAKLGITLKQSRIPNTRDAVDLAIADAAAGRGLGQGTVDAIWINGENFFTLAQQDLLFGAFADKLPNSKFFFFDPKDARSGPNLFDFGFPTGLREMPWSASQYLCHIETSRLSRADAPKDFAGLEAYVRANPGRFTYVAPPDFNGNTFVQEVMYAFNPDGTTFEPFQKNAADLGAAEFARLTKPGFEFLQRIEPFLLGGGGQDGNRGMPIYPETPNANDTLLTNGEVDMDCAFGPFRVNTRINSGDLSPTTENLIFPEGLMIKNKNFIGIPGNAPHPAAALVLANVLSEPSNHIDKLATIGFELGVDVPLLSDADKELASSQAPSLRGVTNNELGNNAVADTNASLVDIIETVWIELIQKQSSKSFEQIVNDAF